jgi:hypothetical protein
MTIKSSPQNQRLSTRQGDRSNLFMARSIQRRDVDCLRPATSGVEWTADSGSIVDLSNSDITVINRVTRSTAVPSRALLSARQIGAQNIDSEVVPGRPSPPRSNPERRWIGPFRPGALAEC